MLSLKKLSVFFVLVLLLTSLVPVSLADPGGGDDTINITYIGYMSPNKSEYLPAYIAKYYESYAPLNNYNINYNYFCYYDIEDGVLNWNQVNGTFLAFLDDMVQEQDIVIFDMIFVSEYSEELKAAKSQNSDLKILQVNTGETGVEEIVDYSEPEELIYYLSSGYNPVSYYTGRSDEANSLMMVTLNHLVLNYAPVSKVSSSVPTEKTNVLYVGYDITENGTIPASRYAGVTGFEMLVSNLDKTFYGRLFDKTDSVSYGSTPGGTVSIYPMAKPTDDDVWYSVDKLRANMSRKKIDFSDYDLIIFDGFFDDDMLTSFSDIFSEASDSGAKLVFNAHYRPIESVTIDGIEYPFEPILFKDKWGRYGAAGIHFYSHVYFEDEIAEYMTVEEFEECDLEYFWQSPYLLSGLNNYPADSIVFDNKMYDSSGNLYHFLKGYRCDLSYNLPLPDKENDEKDINRILLAGFLPLSNLVNNDKIFSGIDAPGDYGFLYIPSGDIFHPVEGKYFKTANEYLAWYKTTARYHADKPFIGIFGFSSTYFNQMKQLTEILEGKGYNVIVGGGGSTGVYDRMAETFTNKDGANVCCLICIKNWALNYGNQPYGVEELKKINVPVIKVVGSSGWGDETGWDKNSGIPASTFSWMASSSNVDGMIDFIAMGSGCEENTEWIADRAVGWANLNETPNEAKEIAFLYYNYPPGKDAVGANYLNVMRSLAGDGAKVRVTAGDPSVEIYDPIYKGILRKLRSERYDADFSKLPIVTIEEGGTYSFDYSETNESLLMNEENLIRLIYAQGINVGAYAPGVLDTMVRQRLDFISEGNDADDWWGCELIPVKDYLEWLEHETASKGNGGNGTMDISLYNALTETWGTPTIDGPIPTKTSGHEAWGGMIWKDEDGQIESGVAGMNYIVVPMVKVGNVRIMPEPNRALASGKALDSSTYHSGDLPPTHQYVAFYMWLNRGTGDSTGSGETGMVGGDRHWKADAVVHFGTHGTQEWLPGTSVGLSRTRDWGPVLLPDVPNIYPYIVANVGEGLTAEYRGNAVIISHMTPPMIKTTLYDSIVGMETAIRGYQKQSAAGGNDAILSAYREIIIETLFDLGWQDAFTEQFTSWKKEIAAEKYKGNVSKVKEADLKAYLLNDKDVFDAFLENHLHSFVEAIRENSLSYSTHVYGAFDEKQISPMVWNMWSRQGFDDILLDTYFQGLSAIPTANVNLGMNVPGYEQTADTSFKYNESDVLNFVEKMTAQGFFVSSDNIRSSLQSTFNRETGTPSEIAAFEDKMIYFLLGPSAFFTDSNVNSSGESIVAAWESTSVDGVSIYDEMVGELFEFYFYFSIPEKLATETRPESGTIYRDTHGKYLDSMKMRAELVSFADELKDVRPTYNNIEKPLAKHFGSGDTSRPWYNDRMVYYILGNSRIDYAENLRACGASEMDALMNALSAGYIPPSPGNDPVLNPYVLPTGRNFFGVDPSTYTTPAAWKVGKAMGEQLLIDYYNKYGDFPQTVSFMRFGVDYIQDEGTLEACLFYLLGCEPTWIGTGTFKGAKPVTIGGSTQEEYDDMFKLTFKNSKNKTVEVYRPRVDVVYNSAGMRDGYGSMLREIDKAVKAVARLDEGDDRNEVANHILKNVKELSDILKGSELSEDDIWELATSRVFAQELGNYEIGTGNLVSSGGTFNSKDPESIKKIADLYLAKMGYLYTENNWGESSEHITKMLQALLGRTDASIFASSGNLYDSLDNDDVFQYFGAMNHVSSMYDRNGNYINDSSKWKMPQMYIADTSNIHNYKSGDKIVYTAREYIQKDMAARYLNPDWIKSQMEAGYSGAAIFAEVIENVYGWSVVTNGEIIGQETWNKIFETYLKDPEVREWISSTSAYALQSSSARFLEAARNDYWDATDAQVKSLMKMYVESVLESGMACCHHTCGNPSLDSFVSGYMSVLGLTPEQEEQYWELVKQTTARDEPPTDVRKSNSSSGSGYGSAVTVEAGDPASGSADNKDGDESAESSQSPGVGMEGAETGTPVDEVSGFEMTISNVASSVRDFIQNPKFSTSSIIAIGVVVLAVGAIFYGFRRKNV